MSDAGLRPLIQALLRDRMKLMTHRETRQLPIYTLELAKGGKLIKSAPETERSVTFTAPDRFIAKKVTMQMLANLLSARPDLSRTIIDRTGLTGEFDLTLEWSPDSPSIFTALHDQLGLRLVAGKGPGHILVIDHIEKPSEN